MSLDAVIFDCDGTLVDSETLTQQLLVEVAGEFDVEITLSEAIAEFTGGRMADVVATFERRRGKPLPETFVADFRERQGVEFRKRLQPIDGAAELLEAIRLPCSVASSGPREKIELTLTLTGLRGHFDDRIFSAYDLGVWKPAPDLFLHAAERQGVAPDRCAVVEDSLPGIQAGVAAGMRVFALQPDGDPELPAGAIRIRHLSELEKHLLG